MCPINSPDSVIAQLTRADIDKLPGSVVIEFGAGWCGYCKAARPLILAALADYPRVRHVMIEDGKGRRLGRTFAVKLWPTLIFLQDGQELGRLVRPDNMAELSKLLAMLQDGD
ncbi:thioredoxin family protein [Sulfuriferula nivalis]|uniref:Thiol reductase thioredoxin n=1 Tax=Sulfuriferula nivalis TaxID=2675298 RepID=A0A809S8H4_9PROT|nr:thioredoxin family protein [Sulfuriferula nivalis]BBP00533.1 thiol reductase thioredoxin [Sulfuriferula nivalis]